MDRRPSITALQAGEESAWRWFCQEFTHSIAAYVKAKGASDAENVTGNVMEAVAKSVHKFKGNHKAFRSWVFSIAHNYLVDDLRRQGRRPETLSEDIEKDTQGYEMDFDLGIDPELSIALNGLNAEQRQSLILRYVWGFSSKEVAEKVGKSESATRVMIHRALKQVQTEITKTSAISERGITDQKNVVSTDIDREM